MGRKYNAWLSLAATPQAYVDEIVFGIKDLWKLLNISYDRFIEPRTRTITGPFSIFFRLCTTKVISIRANTRAGTVHPESFWTETQLDNGKCPTVDERSS